MTSIVPVVAAVIRGREGKILVSRRPAHLHQGDKWEFPGGKIEAGEAPQAALSRELREELGITPVVSRPLIRITHHYPDKSVCLDVWEVIAFSGQPAGREGQAIEWVEPALLGKYEFPAANLPIIKAAQLPSTWLVTPDPSTWDADAFFASLEASLEAGVGGVILRTAMPAGEDLQALIDEVAHLCSEFEVPLSCNVDPEARLPRGVFRHLTAARLMSLTSAPQVAWSASCHDPSELEQAARWGATFALLSPVLHTASHPEAKPLGWEQFSEWVMPALLPVYAMGGVDNSHVLQARRCGGQGVAGISGFWKEATAETEA
jgi:8-oxo-dGTP diphosphatase